MIAADVEGVNKREMSSWALGGYITPLRRVTLRCAVRAIHVIRYVDPILSNHD